MSTRNPPDIERFLACDVGVDHLKCEHWPVEEELPTSLSLGIRGGIPGVAAQQELGMPHGKIGTPKDDWLDEFT